jgi:signal transduction histidine kinase
MISNQASERLLRLNDKIMKQWEARAIVEVTAAIPGNSLALRNSLPEFLRQIAGALSTKTDRTAVRIKWDRDESTRVGKKHGRERAGELNYTMDQLIFEYQLLRQAICNVMEEEAPLSELEREVITCAVEQAVNDASTEFSETLSDIQEKFTYALAHDLRGPITSAVLSSQILIRSENSTEQQRKHANRIISSMDRMEIMISDLLDAGRIRAGEKLTLVTEACDIDQILRQTADELNQAEDRIRWKSNGPLTGNWSKSGLRRVVENLVSNALKFSAPKSIITLSVKQTDAAVEISVHNQGEPIPAADQAVLFQQFRRARTAENKSGWGIGLSVVKGIVEAHGGRVEVESEKGTGTTFRVILPNAVRS